MSESVSGTNKHGGSEEDRDLRSRLAAQVARGDELEKQLATERAAAIMAKRDAQIRDAAKSSNDPHVAALLLRESLGDHHGEQEIAKVIADLRERKPYLFPREPTGAAIAAPEFADAATPTNSALMAAAQKARASGDRRDLVEYLHLRSQPNR